LTAGKKYAIVIHSIVIPTSAVGVNNIPIAMYSVNAANAILDGKVFFDMISPYTGGTAGAGL